MFHLSPCLPCCNGCRDFWGSELLGFFSETPNSLLPPWAHVASTVMCCFCPCWLRGWFLQESFSTSRPRGHLVSAGQDHSIEGLLLRRHYSWDSLSLCCGGSAEGFPGSPIIPHPPSTCPQQLEVCTSELLCHVPALEAWQASEDLRQATCRQTHCSSLRCSPNPSCKLG